MKLANPLAYPLAVLAGGLVLVGLGRVARWPAIAAVPVAVGVATAGAALLAAREPESFGLDDPALEGELRGVKGRAIALAAGATALRAEAARLLVEPSHLEVLAAVQFACDRVAELPGRVDALARQMAGSDALLSVADLERQRDRVLQTVRGSTGAARAEFEKLAASLERNIDLAQQGESVRQAQVANLSTAIADAGGALQELQNGLRAASLADPEQIEALRSPLERLGSARDGIDLLLG